MCLKIHRKASSPVLRMGFEEQWTTHRGMTGVPGSCHSQGKGVSRSCPRHFACRPLSLNCNPVLGKLLRNMGSEASSDYSSTQAKMSALFMLCLWRSRVKLGGLMLSQNPTHLQWLVSRNNPNRVSTLLLPSRIVQGYLTSPSGIVPKSWAARDPGKAVVNLRLLVVSLEKGLLGGQNGLYVNPQCLHTLASL